jgi:hypothetical protein
MLNFKGMRFPIDVILVCIRWYAAYPLSYRHLEEMMEERGVSVDHSSINRWAVRFLPLIEKMAGNTSAPSVAAGEWMRPISRSRGLEIPLPRRRQAGQDCRLPANGQARHACSEALLRKGDGCERQSRQDRDGQEWCQ